MTKIKKYTLTACALILVCVSLALFTTSHNTSISKPELAVKVNLDPPSQSDKQRVEDNKQNIVKNEKEHNRIQPPLNTNEKRAVTPTVTYAGQYSSGTTVEIGGYVNGVFEDGGTCIAVFTKDSYKLTGTSSSVKNVNAVDCPAIVLPTSQFPVKGTWSLTLTYSSSTAFGTTQPSTIEVK